MEKVSFIYLRVLKEPALWLCRLSLLVKLASPVRVQQIPTALLPIQILTNAPGETLFGLLQLCGHCQPLGGSDLQALS